VLTRNKRLCASLEQEFDARRNETAMKKEARSGNFFIVKEGPAANALTKASLRHRENLSTKSLGLSGSELYEK